MYNIFNNKQLTINNQYRLGSQGKQHLPFSLVHLILCYTEEVKCRF